MNAQEFRGMLDRTENWRNSLVRRRIGLQSAKLQVEGTLLRMVGLTLEAGGCQAAIGSRCRIVVDNDDDVIAEVVGFGDDRLYLMPVGDIRGLRPGARVIPLGQSGAVEVDESLLGRVINGAGEPLDGSGPINCKFTAPLEGQVIKPIATQPHSPAIGYRH